MQTKSVVTGPAVTATTNTTTSEPADQHLEQAKEVIAQFLALYGPEGSNRVLAREQDTFHRDGGQKHEHSVSAQHLQLAPGYNPKDALKWDNQQASFILDGKKLSQDEAMKALADALGSGKVSVASLRMTMDVQSRVQVEEAGKDFEELVTGFIDARNTQRALDGKKLIGHQRQRTPVAFSQGDAEHATRSFHHLLAARNRVEAQCLNQIGKIAAPQTDTERIQYLEKLGYHGHVAASMVRDVPHVANAVIELALANARLPENAREGWQFYYPGDMAFQPVTLLRGIDAEAFDPRWAFKFDKMAGKEFAFFSPVLGYPFMRSIWSHTGGKAGPERTGGLVVEFQLPRFLVMRTDNGHPCLVQKMVPDQEPFISRIGKVPFNHEASSLSDHADFNNAGHVIQWHGPTEIKEAGLVTPKDPSHPGAPLEVLNPAEWVTKPDP